MYIHFFSNLDSVIKRDRSFSPFLYNGTISDIFMFSGKTPLDIDRLNICVRGFKMVYFIFLSNLLLILSYPELIYVFFYFIWCDMMFSDSFVFYSSSDGVLILVLQSILLHFPLV